MRRIMKIGRATIAVVLLLVLVASSVCIILPVKAAPLDTYHSSWKLVRETADEDGATFAAVYNLSTGGNFANKDSSTVANGGPYRIRSYHGSPGTEFQSSGGAWMFAICGKNYDVGSDNAIDNTFSFNVVGWSRINGMLQNICEGDAILGNQAVILYPDDSADAVGALVSETSVTYTHSNETFTVTNEGFTGTVAGMMVYALSANETKLTSGYYAITTATDANNIIISGALSTADTTATVSGNPVFWADTINLDETTKWPSVAVYNSGDNEMAFIVIDTTGLEWIQFVIYDATPAQTGECGDITVFGRLY